MKARLKELPNNPRQGKPPGSHVTAAVSGFYGRDVICAVFDKTSWHGQDQTHRAQAEAERPAVGGSLEMAKVSQSQLSCTPFN